MSFPILPPTEEPAEYNQNYILYWNNVILDLTRLVVTINGPQNEPPSTARALAILHLGINDAYFAINKDPAGVNTTYLTPGNSDPNFALPPLDGASDAHQAVNGAAVTILQTLYVTPDPTVANATTEQLNTYLQAAVFAANLDTLSVSYNFGVAVGKAILNLLNIKPGEIGFGQGNYTPPKGKYKFQDDPTNPIRIVHVDINNPNGPTQAVRFYDAPFYGQTAKRIAVQFQTNGQPDEHILADPPVGFGTNDPKEYYASFDDIYREGGASTLATTKRVPAQTTDGFFWAYDGSNLLGTPPRLFNQILRKIAFERKPAGITDEKTNADFVRLFAIANTAIGDAGIFAWLEKYTFSFWRPLTGVREDYTDRRDPFWFTLSAPATNSNAPAFKPPFPSYPSGHATFAGAFFQAIRLYYKRRDHLSFKDTEADDISFDFVSEEINGVSRDLRQPYNPALPITDQQGIVRTRVVKHYPSLWAAMFEVGLSRVFLGVHWRFDAYASKDVLANPPINPDGTSNYKNPKDITYVTTGPRADMPGKQFVIGGVPLGINIANDIFQSNVKPTPPSKQPDDRTSSGFHLP